MAHLSQTFTTWSLRSLISSEVLLCRVPGTGAAPVRRFAVRSEGELGELGALLIPKHLEKHVEHHQIKNIKKRSF